MASILELYGTTGPKTGTIDSKGKDKTPIEPDGGLDLAKDEKKLKKARGGDLNTTKKYSDSVKR
jgi:hypothetical protein